MEHWFDALTKRLAADSLSRRNFITAGGAAFAAVATGWSWGRAFAEEPPEAAAAAEGAKRINVPPPEPVTMKFGPCTATSQGPHFEHSRTSTGTAAGTTVALTATRTLDSKAGMTSAHTVSLNGKQQFQISMAQGRGPESRSMHITIGDAFGYNGADLTSSDDGKTLTGTIDGRAIQPFVVGPGKKPQFVDGKPLNAKIPAGFKEALAAAMAQSTKDLGQCTAAAERGGVAEQTPTADRMEKEKKKPRDKNGPTGPSEANSKPITSINYNAYFSAGCTKCLNNCCVSMWTVGEKTVGCILGFFVFDFSDCETLANLSGKQFSCLEGCNHVDACHNTLCLGAGQPTTFGLPSCDKGQSCVGNTGLCCPNGYPVACHGDYATVCCATDMACMRQPIWYTQWSNYASGGEVLYAGQPKPNVQGPPKIPLQTCCPANQVCGTEIKGSPPFAKSNWLGMCCPVGQVCAKSLDPFPLTDTVATGMPFPKVLPVGKPICCEPSKVKDGKCCTKTWCGEHCCAEPGQCKNGRCCKGTWCGDTCCETGASCVNGKCCSGVPCGDKCCPGGDKCIDGKCSSICLSQQWTSDGKCCTGGVACGKACCPGGCEDASTSRCKKTSKCAEPRTTCISQMPNSNATMEVCCPKGASCYDGKCCPGHQQACAHKNTGVWGCWPPKQCQVAAPPK